MGKKTGNPRGRPRGAQNRITKQRIEQMERVASVIGEAIPNAFQGDSHALLMAIYKDPAQALEIRLDAAKAAIAYEKPRLAAVEHSGNQDKPLSMQIVSGVPRPHEEDKPLVNGHGPAH